MLKDYIKEKNWIFSELSSDANILAEKSGIPPIIASAIVLRAETNPASYISPDFNDFFDPFLLNGMQDAVEKIKNAIENMKTIIVYGDYDVDGITATYILTHYLKSVGAIVSYYIPSRTEEGYGLNIKALTELRKKGADLIITVDLGITAKEEAKYCKEIGLDLIVTDHHLPVEDKIPEDTIVINPKTSSSYPFKQLAGAAVAFKLVYALSNLNKNIFDFYIPFCAIGTIADLVDLQGENRFIAKYGLSQIKNSKNLGLSALIDVAKIDKDDVSSGQVSFGIAPRLNAAGRIAAADTSVELFLSEDYDKAYQIALYLDEENSKRKLEEEKIFNRAIEIIEKNGLENNNVIVVAEKGWHHGVIGIAASKITEKYYRPSIVISIDSDGTAKGSGRSISGFDLFEALKNCENLLTKFGGHLLAAGLSLNEQSIAEFSDKINEYAKSVMTDDILTPKIKIDSQIKISDINLQNTSAIKVMEPFGIKNSQPVFSIQNVKIKNIRHMQDKPHSFVTFYSNDGEATAPAFNLKDKILCFAEGDTVDICGTLGENTYNGVTKAQFIIRDIRPSRRIFFSKDDLRRFYIFLKEQNDTFDVSFAANIAKCGLIKIYRMLNVLKELKMIDFTLCDDKISFSKSKRFFEKTDLALSKEFNIYSN